MDYKVYKTDDSDLNPSLFTGYNNSQPKTAVDMNAADADGAYHTYHLPVPIGGVPENYIPSKLQSGEYEGVEYKADNEGVGQVDLTFDGVKDIATIASDWNAANVGNEISHDSTSPTTVPTVGTLSLQGDGVWHLVRDAASLLAFKQAENQKAREAQIISESKTADDAIHVELNQVSAATNLMLQVDNIFEYLKALQTAASILDSAMSTAGQNAKTALQAAKDGMMTNIQTLRATRDANIGDQAAVDGGGLTYMPYPADGLPSGYADDFL